MNENKLEIDVNSLKEVEENAKIEDKNKYIPLSANWLSLIKNYVGEMIILDKIGKKDSSVIPYDYRRDVDINECPSRISCKKCGGVAGTLLRIDKSNKDLGYICKGCNEVKN
jgi:hypothetical protein